MVEKTESPRLAEVSEAPAPKRPRWVLYTGLVLLTAFITFGLTALAMNIMDRKHEAEIPYARLVEVDETTVDPAVWGENFPLQYEMYLATSEMNPTTYAGSHAVEHTPTDSDPRTIVSSSRIEEDPRLVTMWAGYPFSVDYRHARGHAYMLEDQRYTLRVTEFDQPGTCLNCHASTVTIMDELGDGDRQAGFDAMNAMSYDEVQQLAEHPVACIDCHDPETNALRVTRPAFEQGIADYMASQGIEDYDVNTDATPAEMRSFVCGQCHVEYYFAGDEKTLTFPWDNGMRIEEILGYYLADGHIDFTHEITGTEIIKAQHPEFDIWQQGIHGRAGVSCADCHMPYQREGSYKVSNHQIQSPLLNINGTCGTCHSDDEDALEARVLNIQDSFVHSRDTAMDALMQLIGSLETAEADGVPAEDIALAQEFHRAAQFYIDYVYSENSYGFHADQYMTRILADAQHFILQGQRALAGEDVQTVEEFLEGQGVTVEAAAATDEG